MTASSLIFFVVTAFLWSFFAVTAPASICLVPIFDAAQALPPSAAKTAIVDITGIDVMDTKTADHFIKMAKAVRLLGADCILSGINPGIAQTLTHIGVDLTGVRTMRNLRDALQFHLRETQQIEHLVRKAESRGITGMGNNGGDRLI